jgi:transketolase
LAAFVPIRVLEQIKIDVCYEKLPVILIGDGAGLVYSHLGTSHQSTEDIACTRAIPELTVLSPADRHEMKACMELAFATGTPVYLRMGKSDRGDVHAGALDLRSGELLRIRNGSKRIVMLATGSMVQTALQLVEAGVDAEVWSVPCIKPLSQTQLLEIAARCRRMITLEEHSIMGGMGSAVAEALAHKSQTPIQRIGSPDRFSSHCGTWDYLLKEHQIDLPSVIQQIQAFCTE